MARIEGVDLPRNKRIEIALTYIYGIGLTRAQQILRDTGVRPEIRVKDLSENDENLLRDYIAKNYIVEGDLRREVQMNIKRLVEIGLFSAVCAIEGTCLPAASGHEPMPEPQKAPRRQLPVAAAVVEQRRNNPKQLGLIRQVGIPFIIPAAACCCDRCFRLTK